MRPERCRVRKDCARKWAALNGQMRPAIPPNRAGDYVVVRVEQKKASAILAGRQAHSKRVTASMTLGQGQVHTHFRAILELLDTETTHHFAIPVLLIVIAGPVVVMDMHDPVLVRVVKAMRQR